MKFSQLFKFDKKHAVIYIGFILSVILFLYMYISLIQRTGFPPEYFQFFIFIIPSPLISDIIILYVLPIVFVFLVLKFAPSLCIAYLKAHKIVYLGRKTPEYGIIELKQERKVSTLLVRAFLVGFLAFSFSSNLVFARMG